MRSCEVFGTVEEIYGRTWHIEEKRRLGKYKRSNSWVWGKDKYRSKMTREVGYDKGKRL